MDEKQIKDGVRERYASVAKQAGSGCCGGSSCCSGDSDSYVTLVDYGELNINLPEGANLGLGCGIPTSHASLQPGEKVLDLGSGAGVDVFLSAEAVGPEGKVIGVDMTPEMIARANDNASRGGYTNVEFRLGEIEDLPIDSRSIDVVLSNCVLNLVPDKNRAYSEIYRVLRPGGRFSISDMVTYGDIPESIRTDMELWAGCIAGAADREEYLQIIRKAGFEDVRIVNSTGYQGSGAPDYGLVSITVEGRKP
jgi:SAM-dependent methyltransferase